MRMRVRCDALMTVVRADRFVTPLIADSADSPRTIEDSRTMDPGIYVCMYKPAVTTVLEGTTLAGRGRSCKSALRWTQQVQAGHNFGI